MLRKKLSQFSKIIKIFYLISILNFVYAGTMGTEVNNFNGFYFGGALGGNIFSANNHLTANTVVTVPAPLGEVTNYGDNGLNNSFLDNSLIGALYAGYGRIWNRWYLGAEIFGNFSQYESQRFLQNNDNVFQNIDQQGFLIFVNAPINNQSITQLKVSPVQFGIDLRPGFLLNSDLLLFANVGVAQAKVTLQNRLTSNGELIFILPPPGDLLLSTPFANNEFLIRQKDVSALRLGLGTEYSMTPQLSLRASYTYVYYKDINISGDFLGTSTLDIIGLTLLSGAQFRQSVTNIHSNLIMIGFSYYI